MQLEFFDVPSPCVGVCQSDEKGNCLGCMRTRDERRNWINLDTSNKQKVIKRCIQRKKRKDNKKQVKVDNEETPIQSENEILQPSLLDVLNKSKSTQGNELDFTDFEL
ncbi:MAG: DUF1289 domain-containing protein [Colwellia sp.]